MIYNIVCSDIEYVNETSQIFNDRYIKLELHMMKSQT